jgi:hypothetical protein
VPYVKSRKLRGGPEGKAPRRETPHRPGYDKFDQLAICIALRLALCRLTHGTLHVENPH